MANDDVLWPLLFGQLSDGICISNPSESILYMNPAAERMLGMSSENLDGQPLCRHLCGEMRKSDGSDCATGCPLRQANSAEKGVTFKGPYGPADSADKKAFRVRCLSLNTEFFDSKKAGRNMTIIEDISAEQELERHTEDWRNMVAHDLRAPLTSVWGTLRLLQDMPQGHKITGDEKRLIDASVRASQRTVELLNLYLDIIKLEAGMMRIVRTPVSIAELIAQCSEQQRVLASGRKISFEFQMDVPEPFTVNTDKDILLRVLDNLLNNAIKFTPEGGRIGIQADVAAGGSARITIQDSGPGIAEADLPRIFDRFYQAHARRQGKLQGTGLGLTFCKEAMAALGGAIEVKSRLGQGSQFTIVIP